MEPRRAVVDWTAIVLAGGRGRRLGGADKASLAIDGVTALEHLLGDLPASAPVIVVGAARPTSRDVTFCLEDPPDGGPVAGIAAGLRHVASPTVVLIATDMPWAGRLVQSLVDDFEGIRADALVPTSANGYRQSLCSVVSAVALRRALNRLGAPHGASMRALMSELEVHERPLSDDEEAWIADIDTPADLSRARGQGRST